MGDVKVAVLGSGVSGLSAAYTLRRNGIEAAVFEKKNHYGGLCSSFTVDGFTFDTFAHLAFSKNSYFNGLFEDKTEYFVHMPEALNYYDGIWVRNPVQNNLFSLKVEEKIEIIKGFIGRWDRSVFNFDDWLRNQYGDYFTDHFPARYTRKYWTVESCELESKWAENRMYKPSIDEVLRGAMSEDTPNVHYSKEMHYPKFGGFQAFLAPLAEDADIRFSMEVCEIDQKSKTLSFLNHEPMAYDRLISTIPLTELIPIMKNVPWEVRKSAEGLDYTSGIMVSLGFNRKNVSPSLWFYIYDEEIYPSRVYSPSIKSPNNVPEGCSSIQAEIYFSKRKPLTELPEVIAEKAIEQMAWMGLFKENEILVKDVRVEKYANVMFTPEIYHNRKIVRDYLDSVGILYAGRFGEWDYLWVDQSLLSGNRAAEKLVDDL
ncbi:putative O-antigen synthesis protein, WbyH [Dehalobacter sp. UNSWDHB]|uniref:protoporphyrinogen/coproporphyrinogen oxidase n=1 Tax=unclassified Dehalobacter TaxID=2635733 RepID=UPI00028B15A9|nr:MULTISPECIES: FAD-dependent oxidoreductase [unclassified Dehalobacter]AFV02583.1 Putative O-antigen synthesis protein, WbyH [Dehalobacter sp. DCA]AFV05569.1 Putative O-antigen synthesis protein, WbyH [Dehalobacter sp. CF]EQB21724.1 putative O-antigen synthesis protein, WbyH [Dehalobacter sp. UNSWDHB]